MHRFLIVLACAIQASLGQVDRPLITTSHGDVEGVWHTSALGSKYAAFMGIPYAKPPIGQLRFEPPQESNSWSGVLDGGKFGSNCLSYAHLMGPASGGDPVSGEEDCLYLNIYTPYLPNGTENELELLDVILYIHGGSFMHGSGQTYGAKYLVDRNVLLVTFNYRLGPFGFLSFGDSVMPGNNGLRDQIMAMKWVKKNIAKFGGNPSSVTMMGLGAGGASVHFHLLSHQGRTLSKNGISLSGTACSPWALVDYPRENAYKLSLSLGCEVNLKTENVVQCLKEKSAESIIRSVGQFFVWQHLPTTPFGPLVENFFSNESFLSLPPLFLMDVGRQRKVPWMVGVVDGEGLYPVANFIENDDLLSTLDEQFDELVPHLLDYHLTVNKTLRLETTRSIRKKYFGEKAVSRETANELVKMFSDRYYAADANFASKLQSRHAPIYFYKLARRPYKSFTDVMTGTTNDYGISHMDDLYYLMNTTFYEDYERVGEERSFMEMMLDFVTSFTDFTEMYPRHENVTWDWVDFLSDFRYLDISANGTPHMVMNDNLGNIDFWVNLPINERSQRIPY